MKLTFRIVAFLEGVSYILLMTFGLYFKYQLNDDTYVKLLGMPHGILFIMYLLVSVIMKKNNKWVKNNFILVLIASIIPFGTFVVDYKLKNNKICLSGFSQGCMMSINLGLTSEEEFNCIVGFSGKIIDLSLIHI